VAGLGGERLWDFPRARQVSSRRLCHLSATDSPDETGQWPGQSCHIHSGYWNSPVAKRQFHQ